MEKLRLGVNIDHVATVRNARGDFHPDPVRAALEAYSAGADGITAHLREDRRHIRDADIFRLKDEVPLPLNMEMAATDEMLKIALQVKPNACCIVPEKREEITTEGGLNVAAQHELLLPIITELKNASIRVSLFVDADIKQIEAASKVGADIIEIHTGSYCHYENIREAELKKIQQAALCAKEMGIECHAGHGLTYETVSQIASIENMVELNIGHFLIGEAIFDGLGNAIKKMRSIMDEARVK